MNRVVITGPTGAIGLALISKCIKEGTHVLAVCRGNSRRKELIPVHPLVEIKECSLEELKNWTVIQNTNYDVFYHFAWAETMGEGRNDMKAQLLNISYTLDAVGLASRLGCHTFVGAGSQAEYGRYEGKLNDQVPTFPENGYGMAKLCAGQMSRIECKKYDIKHVWTRILSVYGPYDNENTMICSTIKLLQSQKVPPLTQGEQQWDYIYSDDAAEAMYLLGEKGKADKTYCIGSGKTKTLGEYIKILRDVIDPDLELGFGKIAYSEKQVMYLCADITDLQNDTGFTAKTDFHDGIKQTIGSMNCEYSGNSI